MARDEKIWEYTRQAGYNPLENRCIIVKYAPENLSEKITAFFNWEFYALQMCEHEVILLPFDPAWTSLRRDVSLVLPYGDIRSVETQNDMLNTVIIIRTGDDEIRLTTQQKALSDLRISGLYATQYAGGFKNWHKENLHDTLKALRKLCFQAQYVFYLISPMDILVRDQTWLKTFFDYSHTFEYFRKKGMKWPLSILVGNIITREHIDLPHIPLHRGYAREYNYPKTI